MYSCEIMALANLERQKSELTAFLDACPARPSSADAAIPSLLNSVPSLSELIERNPRLCSGEDRTVLERCLYDMLTDGQPLERFVEFGLWVLDQCAARGSAKFLAQLDASHISAFLDQELFRYSVLHKRHQTALLPTTIRGLCEMEWCGRQGVLCCSRCYRHANRRVLYCSQECQLKHWVTHRRNCGRKDEEVSGDVRINTDSEVTSVPE